MKVHKSMKEIFSQKDEWRNDRIKIAKKAFEGGFMIYSKATQTWYGWRQYVESGEEVIYDEHYGGEKAPQVTLIAPGQALIAQAEKVGREQEKLIEMAKLIAEAFSYVTVKKK